MGRRWLRGDERCWYVFCSGCDVRNGLRRLEALGGGGWYTARSSKLNLLCRNSTTNLSFRPLIQEEGMKAEAAFIGLVAISGIGLAPQSATAMPSGLPNADQVFKR
jgi:hypothetical protein